MTTSSSLRTVATGLLGATLLAGVTAIATAQTDHHGLTQADQISWGPVPTLPAGAQGAVLEGQPSAAGPFTMRLKFPANYRIPPHWHPAVERVTVLSGALYMGMGEKFDAGASQALKVGGLAIMPARSPHFAWTRDETVVQLHGTGPWGITYLNPDEDPRKQ